MGQSRGRPNRKGLVADPVIQATDYHTAGEPFRIVTGGVAPLEGATILDKRRFALERLDDVRRLLVHEPRGHADMYGCFVTEPNDEGADLGVVFFHNAGYSTACGHGTIALVTWALETGRLEAVEPGDPRRRRRALRAARDRRFGARTAASSASASRNVPSYVEARAARGRGPRRRRRLRRRLLRLAWSRRFPCRRRACRGLIELGREVKRELEAGQEFVHPARAGAPRHLRRHLLRAPRRGPAAPAAQRHGLRRRRGRPLALRERHLGAPRPSRCGRGAPARRRARPREHRRDGVLGSRRGRRRGRRAGRRSSPRSRAARTGPASTSSSSTSGTSSARASCSARTRRSGRVRQVGPPSPLREISSPL